MKFDMAVKRAERLLHKNWEAVEREGHRLAALGLPVEVSRYRVVLTGHHEVATLTVSLTPATPWAAWCGHQPGSVSTDYQGTILEAVAEVLDLQLAELERRGHELGEVAQEMVKIQ